MKNKVKMGKKAGRPRKKKGTKSVNTGRKRKEIKDASVSVKYSRAHEIIEMCNGDENILKITLAFLENLSQYTKVIQISKHCHKDPETVKIALNLLSKNKVAQQDLENNNSMDSSSLIERHSAETAFAFYVNNDFTKAKWINLHKDCKSRYPSYDVIKKEKDKCKPNNYFISENEVRVTLQALLNKSAERLVYALTMTQDKDNFDNCVLLVNLGFDGSSGHVNPHQKINQSDPQARQATSTLFITSMTILRLTYKDEHGNPKEWLNAKPQSFKFCRPLRLALELETKVNVKKEHDRISREIHQLEEHSFTTNDKAVRMQYSCCTCMFDGKDVNIIVENKDSAKCPICLKSPYQFGKYEENEYDDAYKPRTKAIELGLGVLHCLLRVFEHLLNISYRLTIKQWSVRKQFKYSDGSTMKGKKPELFYSKSI